MMDIAGYSSFKSTRELAAAMYFDWLNKQGILEQFTTPESIPSATYKLNFSISDFFILEMIFDFLTSYKVFNDAGGMYTLLSDIEKLRKKFPRTFDEYKSNPTYRILEHGLKLLEERLVGGTGLWNIQTNNYLFERAFTQKAQSYFLHYLLEYMDISKIKNMEDISIGIYGSYPDIYIDNIFNKLDFANAYYVITPNEILKKKAISYCETVQQASKYSEMVFSKGEVGANTIDILVIANGLYHHFDSKTHARYFSDIVNSGGKVYLKNHSSPKHMTGVEPIVFTHPNSFPDNANGQIIKSLRSFSFQDVKSIGPKELMLEVSRN